MSENNQDQNKLILERRKKLTSLRDQGFNFPKSVEIDAYAHELKEAFGDLSNDELGQYKKEVRIAGRMMAKRVMGKSSFSKLKDISGDIQIFLSSSDLSK